MQTEDTESLGRQRAKPSKIKARHNHRPVRTARTLVHHYNSTQYTITQRQFFFQYSLPPDITSQMWSSGGKGRREAVAH